MHFTVHYPACTGSPPHLVVAAVGRVPEVHGEALDADVVQRRLPRHQPCGGRTAARTSAATAQQLRSTWAATTEGVRAQNVLHSPNLLAQAKRNTGRAAGMKQWQQPRTHAAQTRPSRSRALHAPAPPSAGGQIVARAAP